VGRLAGSVRPRPSLVCAGRVTVARVVGHWPLNEVAGEGFVCGGFLGGEPDLGGNQPPGGQEQVLAVAGACNGLSDGCDAGSSGKRSLLKLPHPSAGGEQQEYGDTQHDRCDQAQYG